MTGAVRGTIETATAPRTRPVVITVLEHGDDDRPRPRGGRGLDGPPDRSGHADGGAAARDAASLLRRRQPRARNRNTCSLPRHDPRRDGDAIRLRSRPPA